MSVFTRLEEDERAGVLRGVGEQKRVMIVQKGGDGFFQKTFVSCIRAALLEMIWHHGSWGELLQKKCREVSLERRSVAL